MPKSKLVKVDIDYVKKSAEIIESTYDSFGMQVRVAEVNNLGTEIEYRLKIIAGLSLSKVKGKADDVALALKSPTGKVKIEAPIPGTSMVGVTVPIPKASQSKRKKSYEIVHLTKTVKVREYTLAEMLRDGVTSIFRAIGKFSNLLADKTNQIGRKDV